jgi:hypothetical protein
LDSTTDDYFPASQLSDVTTRKDIIFTNAELACKGEVKSGVNFQVGVSAKPVVYPVSGEIQNALNNALSGKVSVNSIVQEDAYWDRFNEEFKKLPTESAIKEGIALNNRYVVGRAWKIKGFKAVLSYQGNSAVSAKAALDAKVASGSLGVWGELNDTGNLQHPGPLRRWCTSQTFTRWGLCRYCGNGHRLGAGGRKRQGQSATLRGDATVSAVFGTKAALPSQHPGADRDNRRRFYKLDQRGGTR